MAQISRFESTIVHFIRTMYQKIIMEFEMEDDIGSEASVTALWRMLWEYTGLLIKENENDRQALGG